MPMIDVYAAAGTFGDHRRCRDRAAGFAWLRLVSSGFVRRHWW